MQEQRWEQEAAAGQQSYRAPEPGAGERWAQRGCLGGRAWAEGRTGSVRLPAAALAVTKQHTLRKSPASLSHPFPSRYGGQYRNLKNPPGYTVVAVGTWIVAAVEAKANFSRLGREPVVTT